MRLASYLMLAAMKPSGDAQAGAGKESNADAPARVDARGDAHEVAQARSDNVVPAVQAAVPSMPAVEREAGTATEGATPPVSARLRVAISACAPSRPRMSGPCAAMAPARRAGSRKRRTQAA